MRRVVVLTLGCLLATAAMAAPAGAATIRAEYAAEVNAICVAGNQELKQRLGRMDTGGAKRSEDQLTKRELQRRLTWMGKRLTRLILRITRHSGRVITRIVAVPPAPGDDALVTSWVTSLKKAQRYGKRSNRLGVRFFKSFFELLLAAVDRLQPDGSVEKGKPTKRERRVAHRFIRITNALEKHTRRIKDEMSRSSELALQLGATECGGETDPNEASARVAESLSRMAEPEVRRARALLEGG